MCYGIAQVQVPSEDQIDDSINRIVTLTLTPHVAEAVLQSSSYADAVARAEAELRGKQFGDGVEFRSISEITIGDKFKKTPPPGPPIGAPVAANWQGQWYAATVVEISGDQYKVQWDGHSTWAWLPVSALQPRS